MSFRSSFLLSFLFSIPSFAFAQLAEDSVKQVINSFFEGMRTSDTTEIRKTLSSSVIFQTITQKGVKTESIGDFFASVAKSVKGDLDERVIFESVKIDANLASVWTPYSFYYKGKLLHCGANSFQLVRHSGVWSIHYVLDTRRKTGCEPR